MMTIAFAIFLYAHIIYGTNGSEPGIIKCYLPRFEGIVALSAR
jgi:hypothetical protein